MIKATKKLMQFVELLVTVMFAVSVILVVAQVIWRYLLNDPITWTNQISRALFCWMTYLGIPILFNRNILMSFDLVQDSIKGAANIWLKIAFRVLGLFFCICWFIFGLELCVKSVGLVFPGIAIPKNALYGAQIVCCVLLFVVQVSQIFELLGRLKEFGNGKETDK
ncbi:MAG: TRAP transporter small permease [Clostridiales bacterium]|nr:TRAP transporter small permease [Clostridiales bacterium]